MLALTLLLVPALGLHVFAPASAALPATSPNPEDSHAVVAVIDTGINPYHLAFRNASAQYQQDPCRYLTGLLCGRAQPLVLSLDAPSYAEAVQRDRAVWQSVQAGKLYYIPGTRIVGAVSIPPAGGATSDPFVGPTKILDDWGHGTAVASVAAGNNLSLCAECLLVILEGPGESALKWARDQPWIDIVSNSWGWAANLGWPPPPVGQSNALTTKQMVEKGQTVLFAAGNGLGGLFSSSVTGDYMLPGETTYTSEYTGPDWVVTVGAVNSLDGQPVAQGARPMDIAAAGVDVRAAARDSLADTVDFSGTSASAPLAAGVFGGTLLGLRRALQDTATGPRSAGGFPDAVAVASPGLDLALPHGEAPLADGVLTRAELQRLVFATARPCAGLDLREACPGWGGDPMLTRAWGWTLPAPQPATPWLVGYGTVNAATRDQAIRAGLGLEPVPLRLTADAWAATDSGIRQGLWGTWISGSPDRAPILTDARDPRLATLPEL